MPHAMVKICTLIAVLTLFLSPAALAQNALTPVTLQLKWLHQFQFAGYYMAKELGLYEKAGFDVTFREARPGQEPIEEVLSGRAQFGIGTTDLLLLRAEGHPVVVLANIFQHSPLGLMVKQSDDLLNIHQVATREMMIEAHSAELFAYFTKEGVDLSRLKLKDHSFRVEDLIEDRVEAMSVYVTDEPYKMEKEGIDYHLLRPISSGIDFYGDNLFTMEQTIANDPEGVARFVEASKQGWTYAMAHPNEAISVIVEKYNSIKTPSHLRFEAEAMDGLVLSHVVETGYMNPLRWDQIVQAYKNLGYLPQNFALENFIFSPEDKLMPDWLLKVLIFGAGFLLLASLLSLYVMRVNLRLRQSREALKEANAQKEVLMSVMGHDMKSYIFSIRRYGEMLAHQADTMKEDLLLKHARQVLKLVDGAFNLMDNLLQWGLYKQKKDTLSPEIFDLRPIIEKNMAFFKHHAAEKQIELNFKMEGDARISANSWVLDTVIRNILDNAFKHTPEGGEITITLNRDGLLIIEDNGPGLAFAEAFHISDMEELDMKDSFMGSHSGAGLALCKTLLKRFDASISIHNRPDRKGARVQVALKTT